MVVAGESHRVGTGNGKGDGGKREKGQPMQWLRAVQRRKEMVVGERGRRGGFRAWGFSGTAWRLAWVSDEVETWLGVRGGRGEEGMVAIEGRGC
ncbi:hypothetical protein GOBAR_AA23041 [Gossypium barbadense]|uniref:Uncharacterized protein n=1 Tax=Gossypium barbadense TaxID=3634 RepID=A0A2P5X2R0_GOSBA|nr:hypothetical protein GOBAR_AA23041 [Gossypium barbadense]